MCESAAGSREIVSVYSEVGTGGKNPQKRKEFMQALVHANSLGAALVVSKLDRLRVLSSLSLQSFSSLSLQLLASLSYDYGQSLPQRKGN